MTKSVVMGHTHTHTFPYCPSVRICFSHIVYKFFRLRKGEQNYEEIYVGSSFNRLSVIFFCFEFSLIHFYCVFRELKTPITKMLSQRIINDDAVDDY